MTDDRLIELLTDEQEKRCAYGTRHGDGRTCDCKYDTPLMRLGIEPRRSEQTGCPELRNAIEVLSR